MNPIMYPIAAAGILLIIGMVYLIYGKDTLVLSKPTILAEDLLSEGHNHYKEFLYNSNQTMAFAFAPDSSELAVVYVHGIHINVEPITTDVLSGCTLQESEDFLTLQLEMESFDRPSYALHASLEHLNDVKRWHQRIKELLVGEKAA